MAPVKQLRNQAKKDWKLTDGTIMIAKTVIISDEAFETIYHALRDGHNASSENDDGSTTTYHIVQLEECGEIRQIEDDALVLSVGEAKWINNQRLARGEEAPFRGLL